MEAVARVGFGVFGLAVLIGLTWLFSTNRARVDWRLVGIGLALQLAIAAAVLLTPWGAGVFDTLSSGFVKLLGFTTEGARFIFGDFSDPSKFGFVFAFQVLPTIIFFASFMSVLYHLGAMQKIVQGMAWVITKLMRVSGAETLSVCANAFIGQTEAPLVVKPYIAGMTPSELLTLMVGGMATIAGGVLGAYVLLLGGDDPAQQAVYAKHLITASIMAAPATLVIAKILVPETGEPQTLGSVRVNVEKTTANVIDAAAAGAADGLRLALNVGAMLLAFIALIALINAPLAWLGEITGLQAAIGKPTTLSTLLGYVLAPLAWLIGVPWQDAGTVGGLIGTKVVLNEFVAYVQLGEILRGNVEGVSLTPQGTLIATYALCGFANFSSIAIQIGGIGGIAPERRQDLARFGLRAVLGGSIATMMTATIAGVLTNLGA
ncbi:nucleoside transporter C-terminal domain-containing protein [Luteimonas sp. M1R5S18]|uniref:Nucleoside transporter C-terminal domain-containing protein n=1 Tax=Luteimonas rhizosphaericola TaxID=3042024 RepID=A0ABT6JIN7_9GAMM|nr:nucleoside transporter C-terminal domain-containing protein [Luteimonas rhizosphaericola]MDH5830382.1 nucleoside transporter C-terminal domain-containing protein [Luteimonas rhizosphaericola]